MSNSGTSSTRGVPNTRSLCLSWAGIASPHRHLHSHHHHHHHYHHHHHMMIYIQVGHSWRAKEQLLLWCGLRPRRDGEYCSTFVFVYFVLVYLYILCLYFCTSVIWHGEHGEMNNNSDSCQWIWCIGGGAPNWNICFALNFTRFQYIALWWLPNGAVGGEALSALLVQPMTSQGLQHWRHQHHLHHHLHRHLQPPPSSPVPPHHYRLNPST